MSNILNRPIDALELSTRPYNALINGGPTIQTVAELVQNSRTHLLHYMGMGKKSLDEIETQLARHGLSLAREYVSSADLDWDY